MAPKYGVVRRQHEWVKVHLMCGVKTNIVTVVEIKLIFDSCAPVFDVSPLAMGRGSLGSIKPSATWLRINSLKPHFSAV